MQRIVAATPYLSNLLQHHEPVRSLRSSSSHYLSVFRHNLKFGSRAFRSSAPGVWNSLPISIRESQSLPTFRRHLDILFSVSLPPFSCPSSLEYLRPRALILLKTWRYISCLLTYLFYLLTLSYNMTTLDNQLYFWCSLSTFCITTQVTKFWAFFALRSQGLAYIWVCKFAINCCHHSLRQLWENQHSTEESFLSISNIWRHWR